jgi:lipopolysaccharide export system protein LptA
MATSLPERILALTLLLGCLAPPAQAADPRRDQPVTVDAESSDFDYKSSRLVFNQVKITQGDIVVEATRATATGLDFIDSRWQLEGKVRITAAEGTLSSDTATVNFGNNRVTRAEIVGSPAEFTKISPQQTARGHAGRIIYDVDAGTIRLTENAWLSDGRNEIEGQTLVYSMREERVVATAREQGSQRVRIIINPKSPPGKTPQ